MSSNYPPGITGTEPQIAGDPEWERWAESVAPGDRVQLAWGDIGTVTDLDDDYIGVRVDGEEWPSRYAWEDVGPVETCGEEM